MHKLRRQLIASSSLMGQYSELSHRLPSHSANCAIEVDLQLMVSGTSVFMHKKGSTYDSI